MEYKRDRKIYLVDIYNCREFYMSLCCFDIVLYFVLIIFWKLLIFVQNIKIRLFYDKELDKRKENIV